MALRSISAQPSPPSKRVMGGPWSIAPTAMPMGTMPSVLTVPLPLLKEIVLPPTERERVAAAAHIGFGNVIKILLRFETHWWVEKRTDLADLTFLLSDARIPVWWTQHPADLPVLTGWFGGPKTEGMASLGEHELIEAGIASLAEIFGCDPKRADAESGRGAGDQLGARSSRARSLLVRDAPDARGAGGAFKN